MDRLENVATPFTADTVVVPDSVPPPGLVPIATVMLALDVVTRLPVPSSTSTWTAGENATPATALVGWVANASRTAPPGWTSNGALSTDVNPTEVASIVYPVPARSTARSPKLASPLIASRVSVPDSTAPVGFAFSASEMVVVELVRFPYASCTSTSTGGEIVPPATALAGCWTYAS